MSEYKPKYYEKPRRPYTSKKVKNYRGKQRLLRPNIPSCPIHGRFMKRIDIENSQGIIAHAWVCKTCYPDIIEDVKTVGTWSVYDFFGQPTGQWHKRRIEEGKLDLNTYHDRRSIDDRFEEAEDTSQDSEGASED